MQPYAFKKVHSLDYTASGGQQQQQQRAHAAGQRAPLLHSVSIVVELAKEQQTDRADEAADSGQAGVVADKSILEEDEPRQVASGAAAASALSLDEDAEDEDTRDDYLSSELARKVVIVDEADKIMRSRAQSAEPAVLGKACQGLANRLKQQPPPLPDRPAHLRQLTVDTSSLLTRADNRPMSQCSSNARQRRLGSLATCSVGSSWDQTSGSGGTSAGCGSGIGSSGELAERGELSKLSMRRYTHHHVNWGLGSWTSAGQHSLPGGGVFSSTAAAAAPMSVVDASQVRRAPAQASAQTPSPSPTFDEATRAGSAQVELRGAHGFEAAVWSSSTPTTPQPQPPPPPLSPFARASSQITTTAASSVGIGIGIGGHSSSGSISSSGSQAAASNVLTRNWSQRRQSLQINLLTGCGSSSRSLTEEELRGERKFNEQVRSVRSPECIFSQATQHQYQEQQRTSTPKLQQQQQQQQQLESESYNLGSREDLQQQHKFNNRNNTYLHSIVKTPTKATCANTNKQQQQSSGRHSHHRRVSFSSIDPELVHGSGSGSATNTRASFAAISPLYWPPINEPVQTNAPPVPVRATFNCGTKSYDSNQTQLVENFKQKRHSLATNIILSSNSSIVAANTIAQQHQEKEEKEEEEEELKEAPEDTPNPSSASAKYLAWNKPSQAASDKSDDVYNSGRTLSGCTSASEHCRSAETRALITPTGTSTQTTLRMMNQDNSGTSSASSCSSGSGVVEVIATPLATASTFKAETVEPPEMETLTKTTTTTTNSDGLEMVDDQRITSSTVSAKMRAANERDGNRVQSIMANAKLRQEEFARLLEEHEQIVNEINRVETKISSSQTNLQQRSKQPETGPDNIKQG